MFNSHHTTHTVRRFIVVSTALLALSLHAASGPDSSAARASDQPVILPPNSDGVPLDPFITTATRTPALPQTIGSAVDVITPDQLAKSQVTSIADALGTTPGAPLSSSGAPGSVTSFFLRGSNSDQTLFLVDGIRLNDPNTDYQVFLGGAAVGARDRIEIARGPQSTLFGADAIGGVVSLSTIRGAGPATSSASVEAGSFDSLDGSLACQGAAGRDAWNFSARGGHTRNARPNNGFNSANVALRLDRQLDERIGIGGTVRWFLSELDLPGDRFTNDSNDHESESNLLATAFVDAKLSAGWTAHVTLGGQNRRYVAKMPEPNAYGAPSETDVVMNRRGVIDAQTSYAGLERHRFTLGANTELTATRNSGFGAIDKRQALWAVFAQDEYSPVDRLFVTAGLRHDDFDTFGGATTGRATLAWLAWPKTLKLRASYGTGFRAPSFLELYGRDQYYLGNRPYRETHPNAPVLRPEHDRGYDAGLDYYLPGQLGTLSATWFQSDYRDLIEYNFQVFPSTVENLGRARTHGVELSGRTTLPGAVEASVSYTYLEAFSLAPTGHTRLLRRPRHQLNLDAHHRFGAGVTAGAGVHYVGQRDDVDAQSYATVADPDYAVARVYAAWQVTPRLTVKARVENALDRKYEPVNGYPALGLGAFGGVEWTF
jgi:vitamin B12 transporter